MPTVSRSRIVPSRGLWASSVAAVLCAAGAASPALGQYLTPGFHVVPRPEGVESVTIVALSRDGASFGGGYRYNNETFSTAGFVYTEATGFLVNNQAGDPRYSRVQAIADGGAVTVGTFNPESGQSGGPTGSAARAFRRVGGGTYEQPGLPASRDFASGTGISGDGQIGIGNAFYTEDSQPFPQPRSFRWTAGGTAQDLGPYRFEGSLTQATAISRDGSTIVGAGQYFLFEPYEAWTWREGEGFTILPNPSDVPEDTWCFASGVNDTGTVVVGGGVGPNGRGRGIVWTNGLATALSAPAGWRDVDAINVNHDGSIITGTLSSSLTGQPSTGAVWTPNTGWLTAADYLALQGFTLPDGVRITLSAPRVSSDGTVFTGGLSDGTAFIAVIPAPSVGVCLGLLLLTARRKRC